MADSRIDNGIFGSSFGGNMNTWDGQGSGDKWPEYPVEHPTGIGTTRGDNNFDNPTGGTGADGFKGTPDIRIPETPVNPDKGPPLIWDEGNNTTDTPIKKEEPTEVIPGVVQPPKQPCFSTKDYGRVLSNENIQYFDEFKSFILSDSVSRISEFTDITFEYYVKLLNLEAPEGYEYIIECTPYKFNDISCFTTNINYNKLINYKAEFAYYTINTNTNSTLNQNLPTDNYYVTEKGKLCKLILRRKNTPPQPPPPPGGGGPYEPEPPLIGAGNVYKRIDRSDIIKDLDEIITHGLWSDDKHILDNYYIDTSDTSSYNYKIDVYNKPLSDNCTERQFSILYGDYEGKGDKDLGGLDHETLTKAIYSQYANILLPSSDDKFIINGKEQDYIYIIDVNQERFKSIMDPGNWELALYGIAPDDSGSLIDSTISSIGVTLTSFDDGHYIDSSTLEDEQVNFTNKVYGISYGHLEDKNYDTDEEIGLFYPNNGILILSGEYLDSEKGFATNRNIEKNGCNPYRLWLSMQGVLDMQEKDDSGDPFGFRGRDMERRRNILCFVRVPYAMFNYSNNPTYVSGSNGLINDDFVKTDRAYMTSIGLYNEQKELLAVGKLSKATLSSYTDESLFAVKLSY